MKSSKYVPVLLVVCISIVVVWEVMANRSRRPWSAFNLSSADFAGFTPKVTGWSIERVDVAADDPAAPNVATFRVRREASAGGDRGRGLPVLVRLVHGYNMPDCMRLKGYKVDLLKDDGGNLTQGSRAETGNLKPELEQSAGGGNLKPEFRKPKNDRRTSASYSETQPSGFIPHPSSSLRIQTWRLTSDIGDTLISCSAMIRASDFGPTGGDVRDMAFPRIVRPIGPEWDWEGFKLSSLKHPLQSLAMLCRVKWNNSRCDLLTFLKLRQPAWASSEHLTFLATTRGARVLADDELRIAGEVRAAQSVVYGELLRWRAGTESPGRGQ